MATRLEKFNSLVQKRAWVSKTQRLTNNSVLAKLFFALLMGSEQELFEVIHFDKKVMVKPFFNDLDYTVQIIRIMNILKISYKIENHKGKTILIIKNKSLK